MPEQEFRLENPVLVCRWRMASKHVPLLNRHMRALSQRRIKGEPLSLNLISWAKQHIEWSLAEGDYEQTNGVLMLVVDEEGHAAMSVGDYEPLVQTDAQALAIRAAEARREAAETGVAPEVICALKDNETAPTTTLVVAASTQEHSCGTLTLVEQLAKTRGLEVDYVLDAPEPTHESNESASQVLLDVLGKGPCFLVSDEHGIVPAAGSEHAFITLAAQGLQTLYDREQASKGR